MTSVEDQFSLRLSERRRRGRWFARVCGASSLLGLAVLIILLVSVWTRGGKWVTPGFLTHYESVVNSSNSGIKAALWGTIWLTGLTALISIPVGVAAAVYLQEYSRNSRLARLIHLNISNLAGVPSIVYGILGLAVFVRWMSLDRSILSGALTMSLLILPVVIISSREALLAVPPSFRQAAYALGATRWQAIRAHVLPAALPSICTGLILALSRAIGEAAPLLVIGALAWIRTIPTNLKSPFTALPIQIYTWCDKPQPEFQELAAAAIIVLLGILLPMNALAIGVRMWHQRRKTW